MVEMIDSPSIPSDLNPRMERAAMARAYGYNQRDAGWLGGVSDRTIRRWEDDEHFVHLVEQYRARGLFELGVRLQQLIPLAVETLWSLMNFGTGPVRLGAAKAVIAFAHQTEDQLHSKREAALIEDLAATIELRQGKP